MAWSGARLKEARKAKGLSQAELAGKIGAAQAQIHQWEAGKAEPGTEVGGRMERLLRSAEGWTRTTTTSVA